MSGFVARRQSPATFVAFGLLVVGFQALAIAALTGASGALLTAAGCATAGAILAAPSRRLDWRLVIGGLITVILFIPIRRYTFPGDLPFALEPYRILVALALAGWTAALLVDPHVKFRRTFLDAPVALLVLAMAASIGANAGRAASLQADVLKSLTFFASFILLAYLIASVGRTDDVSALLRLLLVGGTAVALLAVVEYRTGWNPYDRVLGHVPFLQFNQPTELERAPGVTRAFGSAEHPIALGALLTMLIPISLYKAKTSGARRWWIILLLLVFGVLATVSRTSVLMLGAAGLVVLFLRPREVRRLAPLGLVVFVLAQAVVPGSLGTLKYFFFPAEGLIAQQESSAGSCTSAGRVADLAPSLAEYSQKPLFGQGFGTRLTTGERANACILDNQWLGSLLELGALGAVALLWLISRFIRRMGHYARSDQTHEGWLPTALAASVAAYAVGMLTFDAFAFIQVTFLLFILLGLGSVVDRTRREHSPLGKHSEELVRRRRTGTGGGLSDRSGREELAAT